MNCFDHYTHIMAQIDATQQAWCRLCSTAVVDDEFPEMRERFELELARLARMITMNERST